jgi:uncharacterized membrane protein
MYPEDYYMLLKLFFNDPLKGVFILIGFIILIYLLHLADKQQEKRKQQEELQKSLAQSISEKEKHYED